MTGIRDNPDNIAAVKELHAKGLGCNAIGRELNISASSVSAIGRANGIHFDRVAPAIATEAQQALQRERRAAIKDRLYAAAERELARLEARQYAHRVPAGQGTTMFVSDDPVPNSDEARNHMQAAAVALQAVARLDALDVDPGVAAAKSTLNLISQALGLVPANS